MRSKKKGPGRQQPTEPSKNKLSARIFAPQGFEGKPTFQSVHGVDEAGNVVATIRRLVPADIQRCANVSPPFPGGRRLVHWPDGALGAIEGEPSPQKIEDAYGLALLQLELGRFQQELAAEAAAIRAGTLIGRASR